MARREEQRHFGQVIQAWLIVAVLGWAGMAQAAGNDLILYRLGECTFETVNGRDTCVSVTPDNQGFELLTRDLGLSLSPKGLSTAETIGEAGFEYAYELIFNIVDASTDYWEAAVEDEDPNDLLLVSQLHVTKGLPFSFEIGAVLSHLSDSGIWGLGAELSWAFHEDFFYPVPDLGIRGFVNHTLGASDLSLTTAGFDVLVDLPFGVNGVVQLTPYVGYNFTAVFAASRLLDASPGDPTPAVEGVDNQPSVKPEFVFEPINNVYHRGLVGLRLRYAVLNFTVETLFGDVTTISLKLGLDF